MHSSIRKLINVAITCKKAVRTCLKNVRKIKVCGRKRSKRARDVIDATPSDMPPEAGSSGTIELPEETAPVSSVHQETVPTPADNSHVVVCDENLQV